MFLFNLPFLPVPYISIVPNNSSKGKVFILPRSSISSDNVVCFSVARWSPLIQSALPIHGFFLYRFSQQYSHFTEET